MADLLIRILVLASIFASVFLISQVMLSSAWRNRVQFFSVNKRLRMIREGRHREEVIARLRKNEPLAWEHLPPFIASGLRSLQRSLLAARVPLTITQTLLALAAAFVFVFGLIIIGISLGGFALNFGALLMATALAFIVSVALPLVIINVNAQRTRRKIEQQFPVALDVFVRALRSGHPISSALELITQEMEDPIGSEFGLVSDEVAYGQNLTDALETMAERWDLDDMRMFVVSLSIQNETGGNLAEILENLSDVIRARASLYMKVRALSSEGRMTGWILGVLPGITFVLMFLVNPAFYLRPAGDGLFMLGFIVLFVLYFVGIVWIRRLIDLKV